MCGVVGAFDPEGGLGPASLAPALEALHHRGPDGRGARASHDGRFVLGHTRLAIRDLGPGGAQPAIARDGEVVVVLSGELYDIEAHRRSLVRAGARLRGHGDAELLPEAGQGALWVADGVAGPTPGLLQPGEDRLPLGVGGVGACGGFGGAVAICGCSDKIREVFEIVMLDSILQVCDSEEEARSRLK